MADIQIYFGSQSGTAECFSEEICEEGQKEDLSMEVLDLQMFTPERFASHKFVILVVATYGEGEPSDNAVRFHKWASDPRNNGALQGQRFCVMGLGDMNYTRFNNMGMETDANLERLGGKRVYRRGVGDDSQDIHADFQEWKNNGLWAALKAAVKELKREGAYQTTANGDGTVVAQQQVFAPPETDFTVFFAQGDDGAAKDVCDVLTAEMKKLDLPVLGVHSLSDRKTVEQVKKLPKKSVAVVVADVNQDGLCGAGKKLVRNMSIEIDSNGIAERKVTFAMLTVASSKCNNSAAALKDELQKAAAGLPKAFDRIGMAKVSEAMPEYVDAGVGAVEPVAQELAAALKRVAAAAAADAIAAQKQTAAAAGAVGGDAAAAPAGPAKKTTILCAGEEAKEAAEALAAAWPGGNAEVQEASLANLTATVKAKEQAVLAVECTFDGSLCDVGRGLATQINAAPMAMKALLKQLRFAMVSVAATDYGNAGERASVAAMISELTQAVAPLTQALTKAGATCVAQQPLDLQDANEEKLQTLGKEVIKGFAAGAGAPAPAAALPTAQPTPAAAAPLGPLTSAVALKMAPTAAGLPAECQGEPSDVVARFYFEAEKTKVTKVRQLRQKPDAAKGLATVEFEIEATGNLKEYGLGGTLSLLPENDPADVEAAAKLMGFTKADLGKWITFAAADGSGSPIKRPFPTPCTLGEALTKYCDLARAPSKKMLSALQSKLQGEASTLLGKLLASDEALKVLGASKHCCRMHEFWAMLGVTSISPGDFLVNCPRQKAREFTIASSPKATPDRITLCVSLTSHEIPQDLAEFRATLQNAGCLPEGSVEPQGRGLFFGMCSNWLATRLKTGDTVLAKQRHSALHLPEKDVPIIMVGAGAGVAPFRGMWEELRKSNLQAPAALFFGCRNADQDWLYKEEMSAAVKLTAGCGALARMQVGPKRPLAALFTAFSRPDAGEKRYVQDQIRAQKVSVKHWIDKMNGCVFICGSTGMGNGVLEALAEIVDGGKETVDQLRKDGRIVAEMWG